MNEMSFRTEDPWRPLKRYTNARIALGRAGSSLPTKEVLSLSLAHARARDAVLRELDLYGMGRTLSSLGIDVVPVTSACRDKEEYLQRPDLGRRLSEGSRETLGVLAGARTANGDFDIVLIVADGLSSLAVERQAKPFLEAYLPLAAGLKVGPLCLANYGRVALSDEIGSILGSRLVVILIGERPGLSSPDSLGAYLTFAPRVGTTDERRNCISNIRPEGLSPAKAAVKLDYLVRESLARSMSGISLKDEQREMLPDR
jgi:ethanolamine ammonia-lyase small subunit